MADAALQRKNMVESQVRPSDVTDRRIIRAMSDVPRHLFVPEAARSLAYMDEPVRLSAGRFLMAPRTFAKLVQLAEIDATGVVLDIGAATGYSSAVLGRIASAVVALEEDAELAAEATRAIESQGIENVALVKGPLAAGYAAEGPYDAIILEGAIEVVPPALLDQLKDGGRLVAVMAEHAVPKAFVWRRSGKAVDAAAVFDADAPVLPGFARAKEFSL